jgi:phenylpropionate dioxygenase-like ring-hydroxylating dioxygenase large terminal subunit
MADTRPRSLNAPYGAYHFREEPSEDAELTHVGPGTPCGEYFRRFWQPVAFSHELQDLPIAIRILGEDLVIFRDQSGRVGLLQRHCSHRGTSLEYGLVSERGIRCCYHGWLFDVDGTILETPGEPPESTFKDRLCHGAYPTHEYGGAVFAYMGPPDKKPEFPMYDMFQMPGYQISPGPRYVLHCNWLQVKDNAMDPVHTAFLHTIVSGAQFTDAFGEVGIMEWDYIPGGMEYIHTRRVGDMVWVHTADFFTPNIHQFPPTFEDAKEEKVFQRPQATDWTVPIDDTNTMKTRFTYINESEPRTLAFKRFGQELDRPYEERQRKPGDYDVAVSQRPIAVHALEHLGATDRGIIMLRKLVRDGIRAVQRGEDPPGIVRAPGQVIPSYSQDTIIHIPPAATPEEDEALLRETGRKVLADCLRQYGQNSPLAPSAAESAAPVG